MLSVDKNVQARVSIDVHGKSIVDDKVVAIYNAFVDQDSGNFTITTVIYDRDVYKSDCSGDEAEFEEEAYDYEKQVMDKREEIAGLFKEDNSEDETDDTNNPDDSGDGKVGSGDEETIVP